MHVVAEGNYVFFGAQEEMSTSNGGAIANLGFVIGESCAAVIDTGATRAEGEGLRAALRALTDRPVCAVINTHMHPDHVYGNSAFAGDQPEFVGHAHLQAAMMARRETYARSLERDLGAAAEGSTLIAPTRTVAPAEPYLLDLGGRRLLVRAWPTAHTDNDVTVFDERSGTLWAGDLLFAERIPALDGSVKGWLAALDGIEKSAPARIVPGHGPIVDWRLSLAAERRYLAVLAQDTRAAIRSHRSMMEAMDQVAAGERGRWLLFDEYHRRNVAAAYAELEWED